MADMLLDWKREEMCGLVSQAQVGQTMTVMGWVDTRRDLGGLVFVDLRDRTGVMQCVFDQADFSEEQFAKVESIRSEFVLAIRGKVTKRSEDTVNPKIATGTIEIKATDLKILSTSQTPPF